MMKTKTPDPCFIEPPKHDFGCCGGHMLIEKEPLIMVVGPDDVSNIAVKALMKAIPERGFVITPEPPEDEMPPILERLLQEAQARILYRPKTNIYKDGKALRRERRKNEMKIKKGKR